MFKLNSTVAIAAVVTIIIGLAGYYHTSTVSELEESVAALKERSEELDRELTTEKLTTQRLADTNDNLVVNLKTLEASYTKAQVSKAESDITLEKIISRAKQRDATITEYGSRVSDKMLIRKPGMLKRRMERASEKVYLELIEVSEGAL